MCRDPPPLPHLSRTPSAPGKAQPWTSRSHPHKGDAPYIFVSYAHDGKGEVFKHVKRLSQEGFRIWCDEGIEPGVNWHESLETKLRRCECILLRKRRMRRAM